MNEQISKYRINEYLYNLDVWQYRKAIQLLPKILGVSLNTFHNYRKILINDVQDIPYEKVVLMEQLFDFEPGTLATQNPGARSLKELLH
ncbi:hypothetical protein SAMN05421820_1164 [Pedobacter steynii]|uniref:Uncharacterized protein n=1 Tax=Pedobacter steynii TaxID=430522 RepID=A0A1H0KBE3_9SPHI|nr:hypothetical protein [Pedobacter steynii]NQX43245.1 hypothetical protein [Pedobacter steynii]SDO53080.1 hypothetical protein SAMN05421820_1164 [Pedobacter steynii]